MIFPKTFIQVKTHAQITLGIRIYSHLIAMLRVVMIQATINWNKRDSGRRRIAHWRSLPSFCSFSKYDSTRDTIRKSPSHSKYPCHPLLCLRLRILTTRKWGFHCLAERLHFHYWVRNRRCCCLILDTMTVHHQLILYAALCLGADLIWHVRGGWVFVNILNLWCIG